MQTTAIMPARADPVATVARSDHVAARPSSRPVAPAAAERPAADTGSPADLDEAVSRAAEQYFRGREIAVQSAFDKGSGRMVHKVMDRATGEIIAQSPPEELLRFFASGRADRLQPWVKIEA